MARNGAVGRDRDHVELVDVPEFSRFGVGRTGHTRKLVIHSEVVLKGDGGESLCGSFDLDAFLGFDCLMEAVGIAASFHDTSGLLIDDLDLVVIDHVFHILFEKCVGFQQLSDGVDAFGLDGIVLHECVFFCSAFGRIGDCLSLGEFGCNVGEHEESGVGLSTGQGIDTFVGKFDASVLLVDYEVERLRGLRHLAGVVLQIICFGLEEDVFHTFLAEEADERGILGKALESAEKQQGTFLAGVLVVAREFGLGVGENLVHKLALCLNHFFNIRFVFVEELVVAFGNRTGYNKRCTGVVDKH